MAEYNFKKNPADVPANEKKAFYEALNALLGDNKVKTTARKGEEVFQDCKDAIIKLNADGTELPESVVEFFNTVLADPKSGKEGKKDKKDKKNKEGKGKDKKEGKEEKGGKEGKKDKKEGKSGKEEKGGKEGKKGKGKDKEAAAGAAADKGKGKGKGKEGGKKEKTERKPGVVRKTVEAWHKDSTISIADMVKKMDKACPRDDGGSNKSVVSTVMCVLKHVKEVQS